MSDVKVERKESISRDEAAQLLSLLSKAFAAGDHAELPFGPGVVSVHIPDRVRTEVEVEVAGDEVEVEVEFKWSMAGHETGLAMGDMEDMAASPARARHGNGAGKSTRSSRGQKH
jgi:amphi-Trp domain-containing protein